MELAFYPRVREGDGAADERREHTGDQDGDDSLEMTGARRPRWSRTKAFMRREVVSPAVLARRVDRGEQTSMIGVTRRCWRGS